MSYILDALRQSDQRRRCGESLKQPLPTLAESHAVQAPDRRYWIWSGLLLLLFILGVGGYAYQRYLASDSRTVIVAASPQQQTLETGALITPVPPELPADNSLYGVQIAVTEPQLVVQEPPTVSVKKTPEAASEASADVQVDKAEVMLSVPENNPVVSSTPIPVVGKEEPETIYWRQLPLKVQRSMPELNFSVHIYSDKPEARMVKVNGQMLREGQPVTADIQLDEITRGGVILLYKGYRFRMNPV